MESFKSSRIQLSFALSLKLVSAPDYLRSVLWHYIFQAQAFRYNDKNWLLYTPPRKLMSLLVYNQEAFFFINIIYFIFRHNAF